MSENILKHPQFGSIAGQYEDHYGLPRGVLQSLIYQESRGNPGAVSPVGARGVAQFMPATAQVYGVDVNDPWDSLRGAAQYLGDSFKKYGSIEAALAEYNGGPRQAKLVVAGKQPAAAETAKYVPEVLARLPKAAEQKIAASVAAGDATGVQLQTLRDAGFGDWITEARNQGWPDDAIVAHLAPEAQKRGAEARTASEAKGAAGRFVDQAGVGLGNVGRSLSRVGSMVTGDQEALQRKLAEQQAIDDDLSNVADRGTGAGAVGGFIGDNAAALIPVPGLQGAGLVTRLALQGAGSGALQGLTTSRGKDLSEVAGDTGTGALIGTAGGGGLGASVRGLSRAKQYAQGVALHGQRLEAVEADEIARVTQEAGKRMGVQAKALDTDLVAEAQPILGKRIEDSYGGLTGTVDEPTLKHINRLRAEAGLDALDSGPLSLKVIDQTRAAVRKELSNPNNSAFKREALSTLEDKLTRSVDEAFQAAPEQGTQYRLAKKEYDNFRVVRDLVAATNGDVRQLLDANKWAAAQKRGTNRSRFVKGDAPMQDITKLLQEAKGQPQVQHGPLGRAASAAMNVVDVLPVTGPLARVLGFRDLLQRLGDPKVRAAFEQLNPVEQEALMAAAR